MEPIKYYFPLAAAKGGGGGGGGAFLNKRSSMPMESENDNS